MNPMESKYHDLLRESERRLPEDVRHRLMAARKTALALPPARRFSGWLPFSGVALASLVALVLVWPEIQPGGDPLLRQDPRISENLEMYENLDFYYWLTQQGLSNNG